jgi:hypothetical protein
MTEEQYEERRQMIMARIYRHEDTFADGRPKFPRCLKADMRDLQQLEKEWRESNAGL